ncbi:MAG: LytTR family DNA-binding domain-containing protein [Lachnospiraceae bacterium]|nr:LytTR family DNA-binding domain-containing protein [Lachnospiraceae bacterium]
MVFIAICDDENKICAELERTLLNIFDNLNVKHEIDVFYTGEELCKEIETGKHYDIIFLDIEFAQNKINGVEVGQLIRDVHQNHLTSIVFISWKKSYALQLFEIQPLHFLVKPLKDEKIENVVRKYFKISGLWSEVFTYKIGHDIFKVQIKDIIYLENYERKVILHLTNGRKEEFYGSLKAVYEEQLKRFDFLFIHASYVVNYDYVTALTFNQVLLFNSRDALPISKHKKNEVRERYYEIVKRRRV